MVFMEILATRDSDTRKCLLCTGEWACRGLMITCMERHFASEEYDEDRPDAGHC